MMHPIWYLVCTCPTTSLAYGPHACPSCEVVEAAPARRLYVNAHAHVQAPTHAIPQEHTSQQVTCIYTFSYIYIYI